MFELKISAVLSLLLYVISVSCVDIANRNFGNPVQNPVGDEIPKQPGNEFLNSRKMDSQFGNFPVDVNGAQPQVQINSQRFPDNVAPAHQVMNSNENVQPLDKNQQDTFEKLPHNSRVASLDKFDFPNNDPVIPQNNHNFPNNDPVIPQNNHNFPNNDPGIPQNNHNFPNNDPVISQNNDNFPNHDPVIPQNNHNFPNHDPVIPQNNHNFPNHDPNSPQNDQNFPNNGPIISQNDPKFSQQNENPSFKLPKKQNILKVIVHDKPARKPIEFIASSEECNADVQRLCSGINRLNNFDILYCLNNHEDDYKVSEDCEQHIWNFKLSATTDERFHTITKLICRQDLVTLTDCAKYSAADAKLISCLWDNKERISVPSCNSFITKFESIMFSDFRLVCDFISNCKQEIEDSKCGKMGALNHELNTVHSQGEVINCLEAQYTYSNGLSPKCRKEISLLAELSADDYHLDRHLYFKCKSDRQSLCPHVVSGQGRVYTCLFDHKFDQRMSAECSDALANRQKLIAEDYKASYGLTHYCKNDIEKKKCSQRKKPDEDNISLATIMLCLENESLNGVPISPACDNELIEYRRMIMDDYELSPEIVHECSAEVRDKCRNGLEKEGKTLHCLLALAQEEHGLNANCQNALMDLIKETEVAQDYRVDGVLTRACHSVIHAKCGSLQDGDPMVLTCLMNNINSKDMEKKCKDRLLELQYFVSRDFFVDPVFRDACKNDAASLCSVPNMQGGLKPGIEGEDVMTTYEDNDLDPMPFSMVMSCLYRHTHSELDDPSIEGELSPECEDEVHRIIKQRALDVNLNPDIESNCRLELGQFCSDQTTEKGMELVCLQDNYERMDPGACQEEITKLTQIESRNIEDFDVILIKECEPMLEKYCGSLLDSEDEGRVMECLVSHKEEMESPGCAAGITHFQLITMKDYHFSYKFLKACKRDVGLHCGDKSMGSKADVVSCLSIQVRNDALKQLEENSVSLKCREQLTVEKMQMHKSIELNPELKLRCKDDQKKFCRHIKSGKAQVIECLREKKHELSSFCYQALFDFEKEEFNNPNLDYKLIRACKSDIKEHCKLDLENGDSHLVLECLLHKKRHLVDGCRLVVTEREKEMFSNVDLNIDLMNSCEADINELCADAKQRAKDALKKGDDPEGIVYECLKKFFVSHSPKESLSVSCYNHVEFVITEQEKNYVLDPQLTLHCVKSIQRLCSPTEGRNVIDCLKNNFENNLSDDPDCMVEVARLLVEGHSDIMADPALHDACTIDLTKHCLRVLEGHGRLIACLDNVEKSSLTPECREELTNRKEMWQLAMKNSLNGIVELSDIVVNSGHSSYILSVLTLLVICIMFVGAVCGRMSRRVMKDRKSR